MCACVHHQRHVTGQEACIKVTVGAAHMPNTPRQQAKKM
jgi:hypothetical protein